MQNKWTRADLIWRYINHLKSLGAVIQEQKWMHSAFLHRTGRGRKAAWAIPRSGASFSTQHTPCLSLLLKGVHANTSASFSLCTVHLMQWMLRILGKTVALTSPSPGEGLRTPQRLLILQQWFLVPGWEESTFSRAWEIMRVGHCLRTVLRKPQAHHSSWRPMVCKSVVCATAPSAPCSRTACV